MIEVNGYRDGRDFSRRPTSTSREGSRSRRSGPSRAACPSAPRGERVADADRSTFTGPHRGSRDACLHPRGMRGEGRQRDAHSQLPRRALRPLRAQRAGARGGSRGRRAGAGRPDGLRGGGRHRARGPVQHQSRHGAPVHPPRRGRAGASENGIQAAPRRRAPRAERRRRALGLPGHTARAAGRTRAERRGTRRRAALDHPGRGHAAGRATRHRGGGVRTRLCRHVRPGPRQAAPGPLSRPVLARRHRAGSPRADGPGAGHPDRPEGRYRRRGCRGRAGPCGGSGGRCRNPEGARLCAAARSRPPAGRESTQPRNVGRSDCRRASSCGSWRSRGEAGDEPVPGADREGLHRLLCRALHHLRRTRVRTPARPQLPGGGLARGAARRERLRVRLHAAEASAEVHRRPPGPPDAAADPEHPDPGHDVRGRGPGDVPRQAVRLPPERRGAPPRPQHHRGDAGLVDRPGAPAGPGDAPGRRGGDRGRGGRVVRAARLLPGSRSARAALRDRSGHDVAVRRLPGARLQPGRPSEQPGGSAPEPPGPRRDRARLARSTRPSRST